jgi:lipopolysaccharide export system protein LptA
LFPRLAIVNVCAVLAVILADKSFAQSEVRFSHGEHDTSSPIEILSDSVEFDNKIGFVNFLGDVEAVQDELTITSLELHANYGPQDEDTAGRTVEIVEALGNVVITRGLDRAESDRAIYVIEDAEITMIGNVLVTQPAGTVRGSQMTLDLNSGLGVFVGRVRATFYPVTND